MKKAEIRRFLEDLDEYKLMKKLSGSKWNTQIQAGVSSATMLLFNRDEITDDEIKHYAESSDCTEGFRAVFQILLNR